MDIVSFFTYTIAMIKDNLAASLLNWYQHHGRNLPWRIKGGAHPDPYVVLVSEFMLQQTTVKTVLDYFTPFMRRFPTVESLATADLEDVYRYWQGLGYYTRARSLHATARTIVKDFGGSFPQNRENVLRLKGIGAYTASSFLALAFNLPETVIDGNVTRIICRLYHLTEPVEQILPLIHEKAQALTDPQHPADYASAIMDLGAVICTPKKPQCLLCPWQNACLSRGLPELEQIPDRAKPAKKEKNGSVYLIFNAAGQILIRKRSEKGLLSGLYEFPWTDEGTLAFDGAQDSGKSVSHIFTHIRLNLKIYIVQTNTSPVADGRFVDIEELSDYPFSTLMKKVSARGLSFSPKKYSIFIRTPRYKLPPADASGINQCSPDPKATPA